MDTIHISGIRPKNKDVVVGLYYHIFIDVDLKLNLTRALNGSETNAVDIPQITDRLAFMLRRSEEDDEIREHPTIALELIANSVANSVMRTWQIFEADITVHASLRSDYYGLQSTVDDISVSLHRVSKNNFEEHTATPEAVARVAVRSGRVVVGEDEEGEVADFYRELIEENNKEKKRREDEEAEAAAQAAIDIANAAAADYMNKNSDKNASDDGNDSDANNANNANNAANANNDGSFDDSNSDDSNDANRGTELVKHETKSPFFNICPTPFTVTAVVSMKGVAKQDTRSAMLRIVALLEQDRESRIDGVSALYVANALDGDYYAATFILSSGGDEIELLRLVRAVAALYKNTVTVRVLGMRSYGAPATETKTVNPEGLPRELAEMVIVDPKSPELMPWMQIESDAALDKSPVAYSLALAMDTQTVGVYSEQWLIGDDY